MLFDKRQSLKAHVHNIKTTCVKLYVRQYSHQQMNTIFRKFKMLALRTMAGDAHNCDVNDVTSFFRGF